MITQKQVDYVKKFKEEEKFLINWDETIENESYPFQLEKSFINEYMKLACGIWQDHYFCHGEISIRTFIMSITRREDLLKHLQKLYNDECFINYIINTTSVKLSKNLILLEVEVPLDYTKLSLFEFYDSIVEYCKNKKVIPVGYFTKEDCLREFIHMKW